MPDLLSVQALSYAYPHRRFRGREQSFALRDVEFTVAPGEAFGIVGESGSGKSTLARLVAGLLTPTAGRILLDGRDLPAAHGRSDRAFRARVQIVFQDPSTSLNPRARVETILDRPLRVHGREPGRRSSRVDELLELVGLDSTVRRSFPSGLSGGQRQRVAIARALAVEPELLVLDEPTSALDLTTQAQICNLLSRLRRELGLTYLFISHDLALIAYLCDRTLVLRHGQSVELGDAVDLYHRPSHPYTRELMAAAATPRRRLRQGADS